jgi:uncharacterized protein YprB with RNaseH-like and TPR domain
MKADINSILCVGYQIMGESAKCISVWDFKSAFKKDLNNDYHVCKFAYELLKEADAVITHNGKRFDWKFLQTRLRVNGLPELPKIIHIDTCAVAKAEYSLFSNRLKDLAKFLDCSPKVSTAGKQLWTRIYRGDETAQREMVAYCKQDVKTTTECALKMINVIKNWPKMGEAQDCPNCGSDNVQRRGNRVTKTKIYSRFHCQDCGTWSSQLKEDSPLVSY